MTRPYREFKEFPVWFFNMPPTDNNLPGPEDRPPYATLDMTVAGYLHADDPGELIIETGETMATTLVIDGSEIEPAGPSRHQVSDRARAPLHPGQVAPHRQSLDLRAAVERFADWLARLCGGDHGDSVGIGRADSRSAVAR